jgi:dephospho-CoA kinase
MSSEDNAAALDAIVHPAVFRDFEESGMQWMESAILFESGIFRLVDKVVVVSAPDSLRLKRVMMRDGITEQKAQQWMDKQWPQSLVLERADYVIVNDGLTPLAPQIDKLLESLGSFSLKKNKKKK